MDYPWPDDYWPHQRQGCQDVVNAIRAGYRRIIFTSPTGMGKTKMSTGLIEWAKNEWWNSIFYTHRRLLCTQISRVLDAHNISHGIRAAGHKPALLRDVQLAMTPSEFSAVMRKQRRKLHDAQLVIPDEIHAQNGDMLKILMEGHLEKGASICALTATPIDLEGEWDILIQAGKTSDGRACGALVEALTYAPDEPDLHHIKNYRIGEDLTDKQNRSAIMRPGIFGRVFNEWKRLNPTAKPTILFAPDVAGSIFFAEQFAKQGIRSAHIDAKQIWLDGEYIESGDEERDKILRAFESGDIQVLCNRFVLREGIDLPTVAHCIFACVVGSLKSYLQMGGRAIRHHPSTPTVIIQDHGGNFRRHGDLNEDRVWELGMRGDKLTTLRIDGMRERPEIEPICCPKCNFMRLSGPTCPNCGYACHKRSRVVVQITGELKRQNGPAYRQRYRKHIDDTERKWRSMYHRAKSDRWDASFLQAEALFFRENGYYPKRDLPLMPTTHGDWAEKVRDVPTDRLR